MFQFLVIWRENKKWKQNWIFFASILCRYGSVRFAKSIDTINNNNTARYTRYKFFVRKDPFILIPRLFVGRRTEIPIEHLNGTIYGTLGYNSYRENNSRNSNARQRDRDFSVVNRANELLFSRVFSPPGWDSREPGRSARTRYKNAFAFRDGNFIPRRRRLSLVVTHARRVPI